MIDVREPIKDDAELNAGSRAPSEELDATDHAVDHRNCEDLA